jgi:hypothetical protein
MRVPRSGPSDASPYQIRLRTTLEPATPDHPCWLGAMGSVPSTQDWVATSRAVRSSWKPWSVVFSNPQTWHCTEAVKHPSFVATLRTDAASHEHFGHNVWTIGSLLSIARAVSGSRVSQMVRQCSSGRRDKFVRCEMGPFVGQAVRWGFARPLSKSLVFKRQACLE